MVYCVVEAPARVALAPGQREEMMDVTGFYKKGADSLVEDGCPRLQEVKTHISPSSIFKLSL